MNYTFKYQGAKYTPERLTAKQIAAGLLYKFFGISTKVYRTTRTTRANNWKKHAERIKRIKIVLFNLFQELQTARI